MPIVSIKLRNNKINLLFPKKDILAFLSINGIMIMAGILRKKIICIKGRWPTFFTISATNAKQTEAISMKKIPALSLS